jgi:hypothetical protein
MAESRRPRHRLRQVFEMLVLGSGLLAGLGVVGGCVVGGGGDFQVVSILGGVLFAVILVGAVFLFTTMSRDLRLLRERFVDDDVTRSDAPGPPGATPAPPSHPEA